MYKVRPGDISVMATLYDLTQRCVSRLTVRNITGSVQHKPGWIAPENQYQAGLRVLIKLGRLALILFEIGRTFCSPYLNRSSDTPRSNPHSIFRFVILFHSKEPGWYLVRYFGLSSMSVFRFDDALSACIQRAVGLNPREVNGDDREGIRPQFTPELQQNLRVKQGAHTMTHVQGIIIWATNGSRCSLGFVIRETIHNVQPQYRLQSNPRMPRYCHTRQLTIRVIIEGLAYNKQC